MPGICDKRPQCLEAVRHDIVNIEKKITAICSESKDCKTQTSKKIDGKVGMKLFMWLFGILISVVIGVSVGNWQQGSANREAIHEMTGRIMSRMTGIKEEMTKERASVISKVDKIEERIKAIDR